MHKAIVTLCIGSDWKKQFKFKNPIEINVILLANKGVIRALQLF